MKVFYHAGYDEIWLKPYRNRIERGHQGMNRFEFCGKFIEVCDGLSLFTWKVNPKRWKSHVKKKWLVVVGDL